MEKIPVLKKKDKSLSHKLTNKYLYIIILILILFTSFCGYFNISSEEIKEDRGTFQYRSQYGFSVFSDSKKVDKKEIVDSAFSIVKNILKEKNIYNVDPYVDNNIEKIIVIRIGKWGKCNAGNNKWCFGFQCKYGAYGWCTGQYLFPATIEYVKRECVAGSHLVHEIIHYFDYYKNKTIDDLHKDSRKFITGCKWKYKENSSELLMCQQNTVEHISSEILRILYCIGE